MAISSWLGARDLLRCPAAPSPLGLELIRRGGAAGAGLETSCAGSATEGEPSAAVVVMASLPALRSRISLERPVSLDGSASTGAGSGCLGRGLLGGSGRRARRACRSSTRSLNLAIGLHCGCDGPQFLDHSLQAVWDGVVAGECNPQLPTGKPRVVRDDVCLRDVACGSQDALKALVERHRR